MQVKQKVCGSWKAHGHVFMSSRPSVLISRTGFVLRVA